jgi:SAM-dependent methyltransferase
MCVNPAPTAHNNTVAEFECNICGAKNTLSGAPFEREKPSCNGCGSNVRTRGLLCALSTELFGLPLALHDFPRVKSLRGLGTTDANQYAKRLAEVFDYHNTFFDREPRLDLSAAPEEPGRYDFLISSDVFEHVTPPAEQAFRNAWLLLKPNGVLVFTVPYAIADSAEHFPNLHKYVLAEVGDRTVLINRTATGEMQIFENLCFHRSDAGRSLEMRVFSEETLRNTLALAGFQTVRIYSENHRPFGIVPAETWSLPIAARKGPLTFAEDAVRDLIRDRQELKERVRLSKWCRLGRRLGLMQRQQIG